MARFRAQTSLPAGAEEVYRWHLRQGAFQRLVPPGEPVRVVAGDGPLRPGDERVLRIGYGPLSVRWVALHDQFVDGRQFRDVQRRGPFLRWEHVHSFRPVSATESVLSDAIEYAPPLPGMARHLEQMFRFRHERTRRDLKRHAGRRPLKVAVTGASGLVGSALTAFLSTGGHEVFRLVRRPTRAPGEIRWWPDPDAPRLEGLDAVVHLAGENVAGGPWTASRKAAIRDSRVQGTEVLCRALAGLERPPACLISASAVGFYGHREARVDERDGAGSGFLADVCRAWEAATAPAQQAGIRTVQLRVGAVLSLQGGLLQRLAPVFRLGLGMVAGTGRQGVPWITLDDLVGAVQHLFYSELSGPVNGVGPAPVEHGTFAQTLAGVLGRRVLGRVPERVLRALLRSMACLVLEGAEVVPTRLLEDGFTFLDSDLESGLRWELGLV